MNDQSKISKTYSRQDSSGQWVSTTYHDPYPNHAKNLSARYSNKPSPEAMAGLVVGASWAFDAIASAYKRKRNVAQEEWWQSVLSATVLADPDVAEQVEKGYWLEFITSHKLPISFIRDEETAKLVNQINDEFRGQGFDVESILAGLPEKLELRRNLSDLFARDEDVERKFGWNKNLEFKTFDELLEWILSTELYDSEINSEDLDLQSSESFRFLAKKFNCGKCKKTCISDFVAVEWAPPYMSDTLTQQIQIENPKAVAVIGDGWICHFYFWNEPSCGHARPGKFPEVFWEHGGNVMIS